ncbi:unnamed protein product [Haemonchus placei]|uniref:Uncharacterized protein n=1 Tax=Haemonchus placei TaxID=6290 RepID=A0A3P7V3A6_HAEPC|nr:unnamed protein product [Haemonchus placei]
MKFLSAYSRSSLCFSASTNVSFIQIASNPSFTFRGNILIKRGVVSKWSSTVIGSALNSKTAARSASVSEATISNVRFCSFMHSVPFL